MLLRILLIELIVWCAYNTNPNHCFLCWNFPLLVCSFNLCLNNIICLASLFFISSMVGFIHYFCALWTTTRWFVLRIINETVIVPKWYLYFHYSLQQDNLSFPLFCPDWNTDEEILLLEVFVFISRTLCSLIILISHEIFL